METMREILFRGKRIDNGEWIYGSLAIKHTGYFSTTVSVTGSYLWIEVVPETVGQFTGFTKNKPIYENDICDTHTRFGKGIVKWECGMFKINGISLVTFTSLEVIGNVHENPSLMEVSR